MAQNKIEIKKHAIKVASKLLLKIYHDDNDADAMEKQGEKDSPVKPSTFTFDDVLALQCCMETVKKVQEDKDLYEKLKDIHGRVYDAYQLEKQSKPNKDIAKANRLAYPEVAVEQGFISGAEWADKHPIHYDGQAKADVFIEKACVNLKKLMYDNLMFQGRLHREEVINSFVEDFKKTLEE